MDVPIDELNVNYPDVVPRVVFEVLSPCTGAQDRDPKLLRYLAAGVEEGWLLDPVAQGIEIHSVAGGLDDV